MHALTDGGVARVHDADSWKQTATSKAESRRYSPNVQTLLPFLTEASAVRSHLDYMRGKDTPPRPRGPVEVTLRPETGVHVPGNVVESMHHGTGLGVDADTASSLIAGLPEHEQVKILRATLGAVGHGAGADGHELKPDWNQSPKGGRMTANTPGLLSLPRPMRPVLRGVDGGPVWYVDFDNYELRIALAMAEHHLENPNVDLYQVVGEHTGMNRQRVKDEITAILHGRREPRILYDKKLTDAARRERLLQHEVVMRGLLELFPPLKKGKVTLETLAQPEHKTDLQRRGASVFFDCMSAGLEEIGAQSCGVPWHDGWAFETESESLVQQVANVFETESARLLGQRVPVEIERLS